MDPKGSLPHSQQPATCPYPSSPCPPHPTSWRFILILSSHLCLGLPSGLFSLHSLPKPFMHLFSPSYMPCAPPISIVLIRSPEIYLVRSVAHEASRFAFLSNPHYLVPFRPTCLLQYITLWHPSASVPLPSALSVTDQVSHPCTRTTGKIVIL